ncbi:hypothetical protein CDAR_189101 [Caerostris darwini]|uniref:Uncharacterized protein n=1 Tax=Caerostris darwini TaxID=1538125 RepID=A0AAV4SSI9_9ARAC|nr:hypothetical protein CDAR_189101 [Caerostris darwini]
MTVERQTKPNQAKLLECQACSRLNVTERICATLKFPRATPKEFPSVPRYRFIVKEIRFDKICSKLRAEYSPLEPNIYISRYSPVHSATKADN